MIKDTGEDFRRGPVEHLALLLEGPLAVALNAADDAAPPGVRALKDRLDEVAKEHSAGEVFVAALLLISSAVRAQVYHCEMEEVFLRPKAAEGGSDG